MSEKVCPILQAGRMISLISSHGTYPVSGEVKVSARILYELPASCLREKCEWYENGCPAHPPVPLKKQIITLYRGEPIGKRPELPGGSKVTKDECLRIGGHCFERDDYATLTMPLFITKLASTVAIEKRGSISHP